MQTTEIKLNQVLCGKSEEKLKEFPDNFFDGIITDPPYEMDFMGKKWDSTGIAYSVELWKEVLRVTKPGAFLFCFGGTRTHHRVTCAIEDAGWIIKDEIDWIYGEGFPKSINISKQLDKEVGVEREVVGQQKKTQSYNNRNNCYGNDINREGKINITAPATNDAKRWDGYGTGLKPAHEPIIVAMKPLEQGLTYAQNAKKWGVAGLNIDGGRINISREDFDNNMSKISKEFTGVKPFGGTEGKGSALMPNIKGRWPSNVILSHSPDCVCVGTKQIGNGEYKKHTVKDAKAFWKNSSKNIETTAYGQETVEVWACISDCPIRIMDSQSINAGMHGAGFVMVREHIRTTEPLGKHCLRGRKSILRRYGDSGGASRFFYCAKAKRSEREAGLREFVECVHCGKFDSKTHTVIDSKTGEKKKVKCIRNNHPTVKPLDLMRYLISLIKMPNNKQVILDPFCGSGTTLVAAEELGIDYIGIDQDLDNTLISMVRIG